MPAQKRLEELRIFKAGRYPLLAFCQRSFSCRRQQKPAFDVVAEIPVEQFGAQRGTFKPGCSLGPLCADRVGRTSSPFLVEFGNGGSVGPSSQKETAQAMQSMVGRFAL